MAYVIDGAVYPEDEDGPLFQFDGQYPPFVIFDTDLQENLSGEYQTRDEAEQILKSLEGGIK